MIQFELVVSNGLKPTGSLSNNSKTHLVEPWHHRVGFGQFAAAFVPMTWLVFLKCAADSKYHGSPEPSFLGVIIPIYWGFKTFIFHGFGGSW